ncbi:glutamine amidotransferase-related protein, partial [Photobacterium leiognathi]|uniref:glutamine amidotransferase-related protein n=1 Tax=Photobacterium leiognathi TaxID=553611 RepID=UPI0027375AC0
YCFRSVTSRCWVFNQVIPTSVSSFRIYHETLSRFSCAPLQPELILRVKGKVPMIGICLGHQAIVEAYGGKVSGAGEIVHGKAAMMNHNQHKVFGHLPNPLSIARYHSLVATEVPASLATIADVDGLVMAVLNEEDKVCGFQFHPESILTTQGAELLTHTLNWVTSQNPKESENE